MKCVAKSWNFAVTSLYIGKPESGNGRRGGGI